MLISVILKDKDSVFDQTLVTHRDAHDLSVSKVGQTNGIKREIVEEEEAEKEAESPVSTDTENVVIRMVPEELMPIGPGDLPNIKNEPEGLATKHFCYFVDSLLNATWMANQ